VASGVARADSFRMVARLKLTGYSPFRQCL
jgi:hypothetical protein